MRITQGTFSFLPDLSEDQIGAGRVDGAKGWPMLRHVVLPQLSQVGFIALAVSVIGALRSFDMVAVMTSGGPYGSSTVLAYQMYEQAIFSYRFGYGAAIATVLFAVMLVFIVWYVRGILRADERAVRDVRPLVRLNVSVTVEQNGKRESASSGAGGRAGFEAWVAPERWQAQVDEALRQALVNLEAVDCPAGEMDVVLGAGWPGVLLHEAIGHGFEGDFHRKGSSVFTGMMGKRVAAQGVTVVDDGSIAGRRGSLVPAGGRVACWRSGCRVWRAGAVALVGARAVAAV